MIIERGQGDLLAAQVDALVNPVNTVGVMGKGLGCGLGGLDWAVVKPMIVKGLASVPTGRALLFEPA